MTAGHAIASHQIKPGMFLACIARDDGEVLSICVPHFQSKVNPDYWHCESMFLSMDVKALCVGDRWSYWREATKEEIKHYAEKWSGCLIPKEVYS